MFTAIGQSDRVRPTAALSFVIVGTPRSGTTLVQRLAGEITGVRVPPETHFWSRFMPAFTRTHAFPLDLAGTRAALAEFAALPTSAGMRVPAEQIATALGDRCQAPEDLYQQLVASIAGPARCYGEKTPGHLLWWPHLARVVPGLKFVFVVRDPRAVVASYPSPGSARRPSRIRHPDAFLAARWRVDQREVLTALRALGPRSLLLRYEDVVAAPDQARAEIARFLGLLEDGLPERPSAWYTAQDLFLPWETWKSMAVSPVTSARVEAWRATLSARQIEVTEWICHREMKAFGYHTRHPGGWSRVRGIPGPHQCTDILLVRWRRRNQRRFVSAVDLVR